MRSPCLSLHLVELLLHVLEIWVCLDILVCVAKLRLQLRLVLLDLLLQGHLLLAAARLLLVLLGLLASICEGRVLLDLQLLHARDPSRDLLVLVLLAAGEALGLQLRLPRHDVLLQLLQFVALGPAYAGGLRLLRLLLLLLLILLLLLFLLLDGLRLRRGRGGCGRGGGLEEVSLWWLEALTHLRRVNILGVRLHARDLLGHLASLLLVVLARERGHELLLGLDRGLVLRLEGRRRLYVQLRLRLLGEERHASLRLLVGVLHARSHGKCGRGGGVGSGGWDFSTRRRTLAGRGTIRIN